MPTDLSAIPAQPVPARLPWGHRIALAAALYVFAGGLFSLLGWVTGSERLTDWWQSGISIKANTAVGCMAAGLALILTLTRPHRSGLIRVLGIFVATLGGLTLLQHLIGMDFGIDTALFDEAPGAPATTSPGRMGPPAAASLLMLGVALALSPGNRLARAWSNGLALPVLAISMLSITGYWYGAVDLYTIPKLTAIALQTATMLAALSVGLMASQPAHQPARTLFERSETGRLSRRLVSTAFVVPLLLGWLRVLGERHGLYEFAFGASLRTVVEIAVLSTVIWWCVRAIRHRDEKRELAEFKRASTEQRMRAVLEASAVPFTVLTPVRDEVGGVRDFSWSYANSAAARMLRRSAGELQTQHVADMFPAAWRQAGVFDALLAVSVRGEVREFETMFDVDGLERWFKVIASPLEGQVAVWFTDVTDSKRQELELRAADTKKDEFLATLAHELRNPLAPIRQAAAIGAKATSTDAQRRWSNQVIERQVRHMALLLDDLMDVSRITRGKLELRRAPVALKTIVDAGVETALPLIERKGHALSIDLATPEAVVDADLMRLSQVVSNLLSNAAKYTPDNGAITLTAKLRDDTLVLEVSDNGTGIAEHQLTEIFIMFSQVNAAHGSSEGGLGIGLALTRGLVELHGGTISATSPGVGCGSTFTVEIARAGIASVPEPLPDSGRSAAVWRILLADDNRDARESLAILLRLDGHEVDTAEDGVTALQMFERHAFEIVLLDIGMPGATGYEVAAQIRRQSQSVLIVAITGWGQSQDRARALQAGFDHHLTKPVDYSTLSALLGGFAPS